MNKQEIKEWFHLLEALKDGEAIERLRIVEGEAVWIDTNDIYISDSPKRYRIRDILKPLRDIKYEYKPFSFDNAEYLIGKTIKNKGSKELYLITKVETLSIGTGLSMITYDQLFEYYTFIDGSCCGYKSPL